MGYIYTTDYGHSNVLLSVNHFTVAYELPLAVESDTGLIGTWRSPGIAGLIWRPKTLSIQHPKPVHLIAQNASIRHPKPLHFEAAHQHSPYKSVTFTSHIRDVPTCR